MGHFFWHEGATLGPCHTAETGPHPSKCTSVLRFTMEQLWFDIVQLWCLGVCLDGFWCHPNICSCAFYFSISLVKLLLWGAVLQTPIQRPYSRLILCLFLLLWFVKERVLTIIRQRGPDKPSTLRPHSCLAFSGLHKRAIFG